MGGRIDGLHVARAKAGELSYAGQVENGVPGDMVRLEGLLRPLVQKQAPIAVARKPKTRWVTPQVVVEVDFRDATPGARQCHPQRRRAQAADDETSPAKEGGNGLAH